MANLGKSFFENILNRRALRRWTRAANKADKTNLPELRRQRGQARKLQHHLDKLIYISESRLALPMIGSNAFKRPHGSDWSWRPELWRGPLSTPGMSTVQTKSKLGSEITLFHDCTRSELTLRQLRNRREADLAPFGLRMDVFRFDGSFLSLVIDLPPEAATDLKRKHLLRMDAIIEMEKPLEIFARLNIKNGPNTEQIVREMPLDDKDIMVEFDLAYTSLNEKRVDRLWLDLIFENPEMNQVILRDLTFSRRPRAEL